MNVGDLRQIMEGLPDNTRLVFNEFEKYQMTGRPNYISRTMGEIEFNKKRNELHFFTVLRSTRSNVPSLQAARRTSLGFNPHKS